MLDDGAWLVSRDFLMACEAESKSWSIMYQMEIHPSSKRQIETNGDEDEKVSVRKAPKLSSGGKRQAGETSDTTTLISSIGRDNSINCLVKCSRSDYGSIASLNKNFRSIISSSELYKFRRQNGVIEHWVYVSCQLLDWEAFDPILCRWKKLPKVKAHDCFGFSDKESLAVGTELLVFGREFFSYVMYRYSLLTDSWTPGVNMNQPRCLFGSASLGEIAILAGGCDSVGNICNSVELYNSELGTWTTLPSMKKARKMCSAVFMDGKFYVIGGIGDVDSQILTCGEEYNLETETWSEIPNMSPARMRENGSHASSEAPPLIAVVNNVLYAADPSEMELRKYDKINRSWITIGRLPEEANSMSGWGLAFRACGDRLIVIGGGGYLDFNSWIPCDGPPVWTLLGQKKSSSFVYNCAVMGC